MQEGTLVRSEILKSIEDHAGTLWFTIRLWKVARLGERQFWHPLHEVALISIYFNREVGYQGHGSSLKIPLNRKNKSFTVTFPQTTRLPLIYKVSPHREWILPSMIGHRKSGDKGKDEG